MNLPVSHWARLWSTRSCFPQVPVLQVELINRPDERPLGVGEGSQRPAVGAIANAFANATGVRLRDLPFTPERVKQALLA